MCCHLSMLLSSALSCQAALAGCSSSSSSLSVRAATRLRALKPSAADVIIKPTVSTAVWAASRRKSSAEGTAH